MEPMTKKTKILIAVGVVIAICIIAGIAGYGTNGFEGIQEMLKDAG
jgi:hypothetical protein